MDAAIVLGGYLVMAACFTAVGHAMGYRKRRDEEREEELATKIARQKLEYMLDPKNRPPKK